MKLNNHAFTCNTGDSPVMIDENHENHPKCDTCGRCKQHECRCSSRSLSAKLSDW